MGDMLNLAKHDFTDVDSKADLINGVLRLRRGSWSPKIGEVGGPRVVETLDLVSEETNAALIAELGKIEGLLEYARTWRTNPVQADGAWLEWGIDAEPRASGETVYAAKRAWVYGGKLELSGGKDLPGAFLNHRAAARLAIERGPLWENLDQVEDSDTSIAWGDVVDLTGLQTEMGTAPGRIERAILYETSSAALMSEFWLGLRSTNEGWASFDPLLELENGINGTDTTDQVDGMASGGYHCQCTFATETGLDERVNIVPSASSGHYIGRYLVLLRAKVGSSTECGIVMRHGGLHEYSRAPAEEVYIDNTDWKLIELGEITIPAHGLREEYSIAAEDVEHDFTIQIDSERLSGSGYLYLDCLYLIPSDHFIHCRYPDTPGSILAMQAHTLPDETDSLLFSETGSVFVFGEASSRDWHIPTDLAFAVCAGQTNSAHSLSHTFNLYLYWYPRWAMYRTA